MNVRVIAYAPVPATAHAESAPFYGHLGGELVRRVGGRGLGRFLHEELRAVRGLDFLCPFYRSLAPQRAKADS